jgi:hypothetical protein
MTISIEGYLTKIKIFPYPHLPPTRLLLKLVNSISIFYRHRFGPDPGDVSRRENRLIHCLNCDTLWTIMIISAMEDGKEGEGFASDPGRSRDKIRAILEG